MEPAPSIPPVERLWHVRAERVVLATGAIERPMVFPHNDRPGVMLAGAGDREGAGWGASREDEAVTRRGCRGWPWLCSSSSLLSLSTMGVR